jgi:hypothetical protein
MSEQSKKNWTREDLKQAIANGNLKVVKTTTYTEINGGIQFPDGTQLLDGAQRRMANEMKAQQKN